jgi:hypothetical protein
MLFQQALRFARVERAPDGDGLAVDHERGRALITP